MNKPQGRFANKYPAKKDDGGYKTNDKIYARQVRLIQEGQEPIVCATSEALIKAKDLGLDLVEISPNADPPVCKIVDFQKFLYEKKKKEKDNKKSKSSTALKEIKMSPNIGEHDYSFKAKQAKEFLSKGHKVKVSILFKGRTIMFKDQGEILMLKFSQEVIECGKVEQLPKQEGKFMIMILIPNKKHG